MPGSNQPKINVEENMFGKTGWGIMNMKKKKKRPLGAGRMGNKEVQDACAPQGVRGALAMNILPQFFLHHYQC